MQKEWKLELSTEQGVMHNNSAQFGKYVDHWPKQTIS